MKNKFFIIICCFATLLFQGQPLIHFSGFVFAQEEGTNESIPQVEIVQEPVQIQIPEVEETVIGEEASNEQPIIEENIPEETITETTTDPVLGDTQPIIEQPTEQIIGETIYEDTGSITIPSSDDVTQNTGITQTEQVIGGVQYIAVETIYETDSELGTGIDILSGTMLGTGIQTNSGDLVLEENITTQTIMQLHTTTVIFPTDIVITDTQGTQKQIADLTIVPEEAVTQLPNRTIKEVQSEQRIRLHSTGKKTELIVLSGDHTTINSGINTLTENDLSNPSESQNPLESSTVTTQKEPLQEIFEFGIAGKHLLFSEPVIIQQTVPYPDGSMVEINVFHAGQTDWSTQGIATELGVSCLPNGDSTSPSTVTTVNQGKVQFTTCGASTFSVIYTGGASAPNYVDNSTKDFTGMVLTGVNFPTGSVLADVNILIDFRPIDNESPTGPWGTTNCYPGEKSFVLIHPDGTTVNLANAGTYTTPTTNCPQAQILYDQSAASGIVGGAWNLTGQSRQPIGNLDTLNGKSPFGLWTLRVGDNVAQDGVVFFGFDLSLTNIECGDGIISSGEVCDDGNIDNGDGCNLSCQIEAGWECAGAPSVCTPIPGPTGLRLHYDGSFAGGVFTDISGNGFNGTQFNGVTTGNQNGETVMCFNGSNQYIERATNLATAYPFTMSTWIKSDTTTGLHGILSFARSSATNRMYNIEHNGTTIRANAQNTTSRYANATSTLNTTERFLVTTVFNSNTNREIYVNGVYEGVNTQNATYDTNATKRFNIGRLADSSPTNYFDGCVDDVRFYSTALTTGQIYTLYAKPAALTTSYTTQASPLLTGTIQGVLDTITITISGNTYTGTNNSNGTWTLTGGIISPGLANGTYPTVLTVTNPYGKAVTYDSSFVVASCGNNSVDAGESCDDGNVDNGDGCSDLCTIEPGYSCEGDPSVCSLLTCSSGVYFDLDNSGGQSSGDTLFTGGSGLATRTGKFDIGSGETASIVIDFFMYDDGTTIDVNGTHIYDEGQPNFFTPALNAPRTTNVNGLPRLRVTLSNGSVLIQGTLTATSTSLTTLTPTAGSTPPVFYTGAQNEIVVGITNQGGASGSDFTVSYINSCTPPIAGDYCIASPTTIAFPQFTTAGSVQTGFTSSSGYFEIIDSNGADSGYYTTLQITSLSGTSSNIPNTNLARQSSGITLLSGTANSNVTLGSAFASYSPATGTVTFIKRDATANSGITGTYGAILDLRVSLPAYIKPDTYAGTITYTLYEN